VRRSVRHPRSKRHLRKKILWKKLDGSNEKPESRPGYSGEESAERAKPFGSKPRLPVKKSD
jgi:hypothetical protein